MQIYILLSLISLSLFLHPPLSLSPPSLTSTVCCQDPGSLAVPVAFQTVLAAMARMTKQCAFVTGSSRAEIANQPTML